LYAFDLTVIVVLTACLGVSPSLAVLIISSSSQRTGFCPMVWMLR